MEINNHNGAFLPDDEASVWCEVTVTQTPDGCEIWNVADGTFRVWLATPTEVETYLEDNNCFVITVADLGHPQIDDGELPF